ncbi:N-acetylneuraminate synthase [Cohnella soli]|uniref:N-acetylneuraminate synthase n=1 Tax=Cohnella soli TaxID=425005 RepID=A0ABW0HL12_9BACL
MTNRVYVIAEIGVNHNGSLELAKQLIERAVEAGADAVKFQTFKADKLVTPEASKAQYQRETTDREQSQLDMLKKLELSEADHHVLMAQCAELGIDFLSTPFDEDSLHFLAQRCKLSRLKLPSGEITNGPLLLAAAKSGLPIFLSTGMSTISEVEQALQVLAFGYLNSNLAPGKAHFESAYASPEGRRLLQEKVVLLHCTTEYPCPFEEVNLRSMDTLRDAFQLSVGYSDHTEGIAVSVAAAARGASVIEKHFTLDRNMEGPDHRSSIEPQQFREMVQSIRQIEIAMGSPYKGPTTSELKNKPIVRKSLVASAPIAEGERFTERNITMKRPGLGISPMEYWDLLNRIASRNYHVNEQISR